MCIPHPERPRHPRPNSADLFMAIIHPFPAVRPNKDKVERVCSRPVDSYSSEERSAILERNPESFLHIIKSGGPSGKKATGRNRFERIRFRYREFIDKGIFLREQQACLYLYELQKEGARYLGFFGATSTADYRREVIKKHEDTLARREALFARYLGGVRFNAEPVLIMYPDVPEVAAILRREAAKAPEYDFNTNDRCRHRLWVIREATTIQRLQALFGAMETLYIADGHHRSASSNLLAIQSEATNPMHTGKESYNFFMSYLLPESAIRIAGYTRMVRDLNGHDETAFLEMASRYFTVRNMGTQPYQPRKKHHFSMYLGGAFYALELREEGYLFTDALSKLDTHILYSTLLKPVLGIGDVREDKRLQYGFDPDSLEGMKRQIDRGDFALGFGMVPVSSKEIKAIADAGLVMPPKSTYIEPKLRSGLTIYEF